ncbi:DUF1127 domain-containing protein [Oceanomicrobium pacificus]|uniref:DUF1127 domain-containing protein n=1 Tax=Oceanomicrobium pacificus TaxID=2692916 RepID=A0A6B0TLC7_9RHOB|nr:DUF1127 domain-containing protein [Oceanomicrobium pacificus]MXU65307.1 DUF1127 domain-containing protein [Oceanomicrobium pacificus]
MTQSIATRPVPMGAVSIFRAISLVEDLPVRLRTRILAYRTARKLHALTDRDLSDIGLERADIDTVSKRICGLR